ncbi:MAG: TrbG/VirB9 family P-type conjugative transfer protein [Bacilli bacterium]
MKKVTILSLVLSSILASNFALAEVNTSNVAASNNNQAQAASNNNQAQVKSNKTKSSKHQTKQSKTNKKSNQEEQSNKPRVKSFQEIYLEQSTDPTLSDAERSTLEDYQNFLKSGKRNSELSFIEYKDGSIVFTYGTQTPAIVTAIMQITDIELEPNETINNINIGDSSRWSIEPAITGQRGKNSVEHIIVKPLDVGLSTSMIVTTDKRTYRIKLTSTKDKYYPNVSFSYPEKATAKFNALASYHRSMQEKNSIDSYDNPQEFNHDTYEGGDGANSISKARGKKGKSKTYLGDLNFNYDIYGNVSWKPTRVYDDGVKTIIEMPESMLAREAPSLMILEEEGGIFSDEKVSIINYRLQGTRYVVDGLFDQAILTLDLDSSQQRVTIKRN